ncbi:hypothetical protein [Candidatus Lucifugimonas marina]|uniref:hypothetical protein n=1 Tax=Candidatus Lucifugimonas marina TaxID=3038979 RepID=UPI003D9C6F67
MGRRLAELPTGRPLTREDWQALSESWAVSLENRIAQLAKIKEDLDDCIGCGCLSIDSCSFINPGDELSTSLTGTSKLEFTANTDAN